MFYIEDNNKIVLYHEDAQILRNTLSVMPQYKDAEILQTKREIVRLNNEFWFKDEVTEELHALEIAERKAEIEKELEELDKKRIRAVCEPSLKDEDTTWLEFYNEQIEKLRKELSSLVTNEMS